MVQEVLGEVPRDADESDEVRVVRGFHGELKESGPSEHVRLMDDFDHISDSSLLVEDAPVLVSSLTNVVEVDGWG